MKIRIVTCHTIEETKKKWKFKKLQTEKLKNRKIKAEKVTNRKFQKNRKMQNWKIEICIKMKEIGRKRVIGNPKISQLSGFPISLISNTYVDSTIFRFLDFALFRFFSLLIFNLSIFQFLFVSIFLFFDFQYLFSFYTFSFFICQIYN